MRLTVVAVGKLKERWWREAAEEYLKRMRPYADVRVVDVPDADLSRDEARGVRAEGDAVLRALPPASSVVALDIGGRALSSEGLAAWLEERMGTGRPEVAFVLGGAAGLAPEVLARAEERLSLSPMTLPHQMARVVLLEQLYRAFRIVRGEPYHR
ncbi:MAG: 23S rRNA (pseudouridine(1915)-N(3))-methyltransferase RlmH [Coriobacteriia bacterium]|nr:23S rRNA (pseudouridine(1915)-N(3))-methyltransferase RlmH [Coriobacteriia bacterium]